MSEAEGDITFELYGAVVGPAQWCSLQHDCLVLVTSPGCEPPPALAAEVQNAHKRDEALLKEVGLVSCPDAAGGRLVLSPTGPITPYDDIRSVYEAARAGVKRAIAAGARRPVLALQSLQPPGTNWTRSALVALLGALEALYIPLQIRESFPSQLPQVRALGVCGAALGRPIAPLLRDALALERGRVLARDVGGGDPERMTPAAVAQRLRDEFSASAVRVRVVDEPDKLREQYPLLAAVARAADTVPRHRSCVIFLEYEPECYERTIMLVGKGVTYDTGGCDVKTGGAMVGMSRDKCGAAAIAGFLKACELLQPPVKVVASLGMVRNSVGEECYVADELLRSRKGFSVRVGNTDAEGRLVMADLLAEMHERAVGERSPHLYTVATLTGHAVRAVGPGYSIALDNHAARAAGHAEALRAAGERVADPLEVSTLRREDLAAHAGQAPGDTLHQAAPAPSTALSRGHQGPAAFLLRVADLHQGDVSYTHLDVAPSAGSPPASPTGAPLLALAEFYGLIRSE